MSKTIFEKMEDTQKQTIINENKIKSIRLLYIPNNGTP